MMNKRYLFRGKRLDDGVWVVGDIQRYEMEGQTYCYISKWGEMVRDVDPTTIGQCTGLPAAKSYRGESEADRLVFEGDILKRETFGLPVVGEVVWTDIGFTGFVLKVNTETGYSFYSLGCVHDDEIIGNTHDNTEY